MNPELSRPLAVDQADGADIMVRATSEECAAVAVRLGLPGIQMLKCRFQLQALPARCLTARVSLRACVTQVCAVSLEPFEAVIHEDCTIRFVPEKQQTPGELDPDDDDEVPFQGHAIDLGEATVEQLALALPIYPRKPDAESPEAARADRANPFAVLANRKIIQ
jgi:uncharacterized metal-binding protein YceD (DUF177 family)